MPIPHSEREMSMQYWLLLAGSAGVLLLIALACRLHRRNLQYRQHDFTRKLELVLQPRETIKVICPQKKGRVILTSKRVLFDTKEGFNAVPIRTIQKVLGNNEKGNRTTVPANMVSITLRADQDYTIQNNCEEFEEFAEQLIKKTAKKPQKNAR